MNLKYTLRRLSALLLVLVLLLPAAAFPAFSYAPEELPDCFPEIARVEASCRYADCRHMKEPDCAVRAAVAAGEIPQSRYESYTVMLTEALQRKSY